MALKLPASININHPIRGLLKLAGEATGGEIVAETLHWGFDKGLYLRAEGVTLSSSRLPNALLSAVELRFSIALLPLFTGKLVIKKLSLEQPALNWHQPNAPLPPNTPLPTGTDKPESSSWSLPLTVEIQEFLINDGSLRLTFDGTDGGAGETLDIPGVKFEAFNLSPKSVATFDFEASLGAEGSINGNGQLRGVAIKSEDPRLKLHAALKGVDAGLVKRLIPVTQSDIKLEGHIAGHFDYAGNTTTGGDLLGELELGGLQYQDSARWPDSLPGRPAHLNLDMAVDKSVISVRQLQLSMADLSATAHFRVEEYLSSPTIKSAGLTGNLSMGAATHLVPWLLLGKQGVYIRKVLAEGGSLKFETQALPELPLAGPGVDPEVLLAQCFATLSVSNLRLPGSGLRPRLHIMQGNLQLREGVLSGANIDIHTGAASLPPLSLTATNLLGSPRITLSAEGPAMVDVGEQTAADETLAYWGIQQLDGSADVAIKLHYDRTLADPLRAEGSIDVCGLQITTARSGSRLGFNGAIHLENKDGPELRLQHCKATVNNAPLELHGLISGINTRRCLLDLEVRADGFSLAPLSEIIPPLAACRLKGILQGKAAVNYSRAEPEKISLSGQLGVRGLALESTGASLEEGEIHIALETDRMVIEKVSFVLNGQAMAVTGEFAELPRIVASLHLSSPEIDIDRLLPIDRYLPRQPESGESGEQSQEPTTHTSVAPPEIVQNAELALSIDIDKGWYRKQRFSELSLAAKLRNTTLESHMLDVHIAGGRAHTRGSADFGNLDNIRFDIRYDVKNVQLRQFLPLFDDDPDLYSGRASSKGNLHGVIDGDFLENLRGTISINAGPGKLPRDSSLGGALHDAMAFARLKGLLTGSMREFNRTELVPYDHFTIQGNFNEKGVDIPAMTLNTPGINTDWKGHLLLPDETLRMDVEISLLGSLDAALGLVPVLGTTASKMSKIYLKLDGPLDDLKVEKTLWNGLEEASKRPLQTFEKNVGKSLKTIKKFWRI